MRNTFGEERYAGDNGEMGSWRDTVVSSFPTAFSRTQRESFPFTALSSSQTQQTNPAHYRHTKLIWHLRLSRASDALAS
ncbi:MAG: hypothetical protein LBI79_03185 [Nitrososphaerota archaeon]|nr:hypothetical protein [Nitrososphaerota archaeon]